MADKREKVMSVDVAIQRELAYRKRFAMLNMLPDEELIPLQIPISSSNSTVTSAKQPAASASNQKQPCRNASSSSISSWNSTVTSAKQPAASASNQKQPCRNASSSWNPTPMGERRSTLPNKGGLSGGNASPMPFSSSSQNPNLVREIRRPAPPNKGVILGGNASPMPFSISKSNSSQNPNLVQERRPAPPNKGVILGGNASAMPFSSPNPGPLREKQPAPDRQEIPSRTASRPISTNPSLLREKPPTTSNNQQLAAGNSCSRPTSISIKPSLLQERQISSPNPRLLGGRPPTTSNTRELSRPITSSNASLAGVKRPAVPNNSELLIENASSRPSSIANPLSSQANQSGHPTQDLQLQVVQSLSQNDTLMTKADSLFCKVCQVQCPGLLNYEQHINGKKHRLTMRELDLGIKNREEEVGNQRGRKWCSLCKVWCMNEDNMKMHLSGQKHKTEQDKLFRAQTGENEMIEQPKWSDLCGIECPDGRALQMHFDGKRHKTENSETQQRHCEVCNIWCTDEGGLQSHLDGKKHALKVLEVEKKDNCLVSVFD